MFWNGNISNNEKDEANYVFIEHMQYMFWNGNISNNKKVKANCVFVVSIDHMTIANSSSPWSGQRLTSHLFQNPVELVGNT